MGPPKENIEGAEAQKNSFQVEYAKNWKKMEK